ncbi:MAG: hypothetical protein ACJAR6_001185, partial [Oleispira sp.]
SSTSTIFTKVEIVRPRDSRKVLNSAECIKGCS